MGEDHYNSEVYQDYLSLNSNMTAKNRTIMTVINELV